MLWYIGSAILLFVAIYFKLSSVGRNASATASKKGSMKLKVEQYNFTHKNHTPLILLTSLFTDVRMFQKQMPHFENLYVVDLNVIEPPSGSLDEYAQKLATHFTQKDERFKQLLEASNGEYFVGGFCVGGMTSLLLAKHLSKTYHCKGAILIGSCVSFVECVDPAKAKLKNMLLSVLSESIVINIIKLYLYLNQKGTWIAKAFNRFIYHWSSKQHLDHNDSTQELLMDMTLDREPTFVLRLLEAEFQFSSRDLDAKHMPPIYQLHGDGDDLIPIQRVKRFKKHFIQQYPDATYHLTSLSNANHYLPLDNAEQVNNFITRHVINATD
ncbi:hypothetical protein AKO1_015795 [Acrasis kona]|uniref:Uncharacterized protein n=1 Tax=Acrasis kona TaxID=1008807 RepID=A0AAW2ZIU3_9EUKA